MDIRTIYVDTHNMVLMRCEELHNLSKTELVTLETHPIATGNWVYKTYVIKQVDRFLSSGRLMIKYTLEDLNTMSEKKYSVTTEFNQTW